MREMEQSLPRGAGRGESALKAEREEGGGTSTNPPASNTWELLLVLKNVEKGPQSQWASKVSTLKKTALPHESEAFVLGTSLPHSLPLTPSLP